MHAHAMNAAAAYAPSRVGRVKRFACESITGDGGGGCKGGGCDGAVGVRSVVSVYVLSSKGSAAWSAA